MQMHFRFVLYMLMMLTLVIVPINAQPISAQDPDEDEIPQVDILVTEEGLVVPETIPEGIVTLLFDNQLETPFFADFVRVNEGLTADEVLTTFAEEGDEAALPLVSLMGGTEIAPETVGEITYEFLPSEYIMLNWVEESEEPQIYIFVVEDVEEPALVEPEADLVVNLIDFAFSVPATLEAGTYLWEVHNMGTQWHELVLAPVEPGTTIDDAKALVTAAITAENEEDAPIAPSFMWSPMAAGNRAWFNITLEPGTYVVVCGLPDLNSETEHVHMDKGMIQILVVE